MFTKQVDVVLMSAMTNEPCLTCIFGRLSTIGRPGTAKEESKATSESAFDVNPHMSQFSERFIFDDDSTTGSSARLSSLQRNIWDDQQGLGNVPSALGSSSYLPRYLQMGGDDDDDAFPTMVCFISCLYLHGCFALK